MIYPVLATRHRDYVRQRAERLNRVNADQRRVANPMSMPAANKAMRQPTLLCFFLGAATALLAVSRSGLASSPQ
jgi:hypothetical protein